MIADPSSTRVEADMNESSFLSGLEAGRWRVVRFSFPVLDFAISATKPDGTPTEYGFRAELSNYPVQAPLVRIWDHETNIPLPVERRPQLATHLCTTFQQWPPDTVYRPWERMTGPHNNNAINLPQLAWRTDRRLTFIFEDLHGILNKHARAQLLRASA